MEFYADDGNAKSGSNIVFQIDNTEVVKINETGDVGVGTPSPTAKLHIKRTNDTANHITLEQTENPVDSFHFLVDDGGGFALKKAADTKFYIDSAGRIGVGTTLPNCALHVAGAFAAAGPSETFVTFDAADTTPSVGTGNLFKTDTGTLTLTTFDDGIPGQIINVISTGDITYDQSGTLKCGSNDIVTASGDVTTWVWDGTNWYLINFMDVSANLSSGH